MTNTHASTIWRRSRPWRAAGAGAAVAATLLLSPGCPGDDPADDDTSGDHGGPVEVEIIRDTWGIPHITGDTLPAAMYGYGYVQAEDHLELMLVHYLAADGALSSAFEAGDAVLERAGYGDPLEEDRRTRLARTRALIDERWDELDDLDDPSWDFSTTELMESFAAGINAYMADHPEAIPAWWSGMVDARSVVAWTRKFLVDYQVAVMASKLPGAERRQPLRESNQWVVGPDRTDDGSTYVQADPHLSWSGRTLWYEAHLTGGPLDVAGATLYGMPLIVMGHNARLAFSQTSNNLDNADVFALAVDPDDPGAYLVDGASLPFTCETVTLPQAGGGEATLHLAWSHHGPVLDPLDRCTFEGVDTVYAGAGTTLDRVHSTTQFLQMTLAESVEDWRQAMRQLEIHRWNFVVGDADGSIFYVSNSRHPDRVDGPDWTGPVDGTDSSLDWTGQPPWAFDDLAWALDPEAGFMQNCNNSPGWITPVYGEAIDESGFPEHYFTHDAINERGTRVLEELGISDIWSFEDLQALSMDVLVLTARAYVPLLAVGVDLYGDHPAISDPEDLAAAMAILDGWDARATTDSVEMTLFDAWVQVVDPALGLGYEAPPVEEIGEQTWEIALNGLVTAYQTLVDRYGTAQVPWGDVHRIRRGDVDLPIGGSGQSLPTLFMATVTEEEDGVGYAGQGSSYMLLTRFTPDGEVEAVSVKPFGNSEDPASPHYADLTELFAARQYKTLWWDRADVEAHAESSLTLQVDP